MAQGKRTRSRRGHPKGKAYGFHGLRPAQKTRTGGNSQDEQSQSQASQPSQASQASQTS
jgi:hypothetical protein